MTLGEIRRNIEYNTESISDFGGIVVIVRQMELLQKKMRPLIDRLKKNNIFFDSLSMKEKEIIVLATKIKNLKEFDLT